MCPVTHFLQVLNGFIVFNTGPINRNFKARFVLSDIVGLALIFPQHTNMYLIPLDSKPGNR